MANGSGIPWISWIVLEFFWYWKCTWKKPLFQACSGIVLELRIFDERLVRLQHLRLPPVWISHLWENIISVLPSMCSWKMWKCSWNVLELFWNFLKNCLSFCKFRFPKEVLFSKLAKIFPQIWAWVAYELVSLYKKFQYIFNLFSIFLWVSLIFVFQIACQKDIWKGRSKLLS